MVSRQAKNSITHLTPRSHTHQEKEFRSTLIPNKDIFCILFVVTNALNCGKFWKYLVELLNWEITQKIYSQLAVFRENSPFYFISIGKLAVIYNSKYILDAATSSGILKAKQKLGVTFNSDKLGGIDFTKFSKLSICSAGAGWYNGLGFLLDTPHGQFWNFCKSLSEL